MNQQELDRIAAIIEEETHQQTVDDLRRNRNTIWEFLGQAAWAVSDQVSMGTLGVHDTWNELESDQLVPAEDFQDKIAGTFGDNVAGDWEDLGTAGRWGYSLGTALGQIPTFFAGGALTKAGITAIGTKAATKYASKKAATELVEEGSKIAVKKGIDIGTSLTDDVAKTIMDDAFKVASDTQDLIQGGNEALGVLYEGAVKTGIKSNIQKTLGIVDDAIVDDIANTTFDIISKNNPREAQTILNLAAQRWLPIGGPKTHAVAGAMAYDAAIGFTMGTIRHAVHEMQRNIYGYEAGMYGKATKLKDYSFNIMSSLGAWGSTAVFESAWMSILGPTHMIKGGTSKSHMRQFGKTVKSMFNARTTNINKLSNKELQIQLTAMDEIAGGYLNSGMGNKWASLGSKWWIGKSDDEGTKLMKDFLMEARVKFMKEAPGAWLSEFGKDFFGSLPRMFAGIVAMNAPGVIRSGYHNGWSAESMKAAFGNSWPEIASNIMTAAYFSKRPHSFHLEADGKLFNRIFETGKVQDYYNAKQNKLRRTLGSLETYGVENDKLYKVMGNFAYQPEGGIEPVTTAITKLVLNKSPELSNIRMILKTIEGNQNRVGPGFADFKTAFNKYIGDKLLNKEISIEEAFASYDKLFVAEKILNEFHTNAVDKSHLEKVTPDEAFDIANKLSNLQFNGNTLTKHNWDFELKTWRERSLANVIEAPQVLMKQYFIETYRALGLERLIKENEDGRSITAADIRMQGEGGIDFGGSVPLDTFSALWNIGVKNNWIKPGTRVRKEDVEITKEKQREAANAFVSMNENLMSLVYGDAWKAHGIEMDPHISINNSWHIMFDRLLVKDQQIRTFDMLTDGNGSGLTSIEQNNIGAFKRQYFNSMLAPKVTDLAAVSKKLETLGIDEATLLNFVENFHKSTIDLDPTITNREVKAITGNEAVQLFEAVNKGVGNIFIEPQLFKKFQEFYIDKAFDQIGLNDVYTGIDGKAALFSLIQDTRMNYQQGTGSVVLPDRTIVKQRLEADHRNNKISETTKDQLWEFYDKIVDDVTRSRFRVDFRNDLAQGQEGDWFNALNKARNISQNSMRGMSTSRAEAIRTVLESQSDRQGSIIESLAKYIEASGGEIEADVRANWKRQFEAWKDTKAEIDTIIDDIKKNLTDRNYLYLDALAKREGEVSALIEEMYSRENSPTAKQEYIYKLDQIKRKIEEDVHTEIRNQGALKDTVADILKDRGNEIPEKDLQDVALRITASQFSVKYDMPLPYIDKILGIDRSIVRTSKEIVGFAETLLGNLYTDPQSVDPKMRASVQKVVDSLNKLAGDVKLDPDNFQSFIVQPIKLAIESKLMNMPEFERPTPGQVDADVYSLVSGYFSKVPVKTLKLDLQNGRLMLDQKIMGNAQNRGIMALIQYLDTSGQGNIYLADKSVIDINGREIDIVGEHLTRINGALASGQLEIGNMPGKAEIYKEGPSGDHRKIQDEDSRGSKFGKTYKAIPIDESTAIIIRTDKGAGSIHEHVRLQYASESTGFQGGELYQRLKAIYDGDLSINSPQHRAIRAMLKKVQNADTPDDIVNAIKLTRMIIDMPLSLPDVVASGEIDLKHAVVLDRFKRLKLTEPKNGYIATKENMLRSAAIYRNAESDFMKQVYDNIKTFIEPDASGEYRKLKTLSIDDEIKDSDLGVNSLTQQTLHNVFSAINRAKLKLKQNKLIDDDTRAAMEADLEAVGKSIVDGEMFLTKEAYMTAMSLIGITPDMVHMDTNGKIIGFKSGAIKPTITHAEIDYNVNSPTYGRGEEWFGKTAFKYNPAVEMVMKELGVDILTFKSANKINLLKSDKNSQTRENYANIKGIEADNKNMTGLWTDFIVEKDATGNFKNIDADYSNYITELPWEAMSLRTISKEHDPLVGANTGVHFSHDNGIAEWIGVSKKVENLFGNFGRMYSDILYRTSLAQKVFGHQAKVGDPALINSGIAAMLDRNGIILEPWAVRELENGMINYFINNGGVAGGVVPQGSLDVMSADPGNLDITIRSEVGGRPTVQFYGEYLPSHYMAQKDFIKPDGMTESNAIIQRIKYSVDQTGVDRTADAFVYDIGGKKYVLVEGMLLNSDGKLLDIDTMELQFGDQYNVKRNVRAYNDAIEVDKKGMDLIDFGDNLSQAAIKLDAVDLSVGILNSRQPRNMVGDIVINKMYAKQNADGTYTTSAKMEEGNVSRINYVDAIRPQDADFDFDKSFSFYAAPGKFWREAGKAAGFVTPVDMDAILSSDGLFSPDIQKGRLANKLPFLAGGEGIDFDYERTLTEVNKARGRFIKMHQLVTYLSNIYRHDTNLLSFETSDVTGQRKTLQLRINRKAGLTNTVNGISQMAKEFIDVYKNLPSMETKNNITDIQNQILFGTKDVQGIFEIVAVDLKGKTTTVHQDKNINMGEYQFVRDAIRNRLIDPINNYLKYNKGVVEDPSGMKYKATVENYHNVFKDLAYKLRWDDTRGIDSRINFEPGLRVASQYFGSTSRNPYDVAVRELSKGHSEMIQAKSIGLVSKVSTDYKKIQDWIENGYTKNNVGEDTAANHNKLFNIALKEYVKDESRAIFLTELASKEKSIRIEIERLESFSRTKDVSESTEISSKKAQLERIVELKAKMEEALSYKFRDNFIEQPIVKKGRYAKEGEYTASQNEVILDRKGNIKEVILKGKTNELKINDWDKIVVNGRRFQVTGPEQSNLRMLFEAFAGETVYIDDFGATTKVKAYDIMNYIIPEYKRLQAGLIEMKSDRTNTKADYIDFSLEQQSAIYEALFNNPVLNTDARKAAFILQTLTPYISDKVVSVRPISNGKSSYDYIYSENGLNRPMMNLLAKIASGEYRGADGNKDFANKILTDITNLKNMVILSSRYGHDVDVALANLYTEPASLKGIMSQESILNQSIYDMQNALEANKKNAAKMMVDYATSDKLVDPALLYKASKEMESQGIPLNEQWAQKIYASNDLGGIDDIGLKPTLLRDIDVIRKKDLGEKGSIESSTQRQLKYHLDCLNSKER
tara:strand:+ start:3881 stop:12907 length:9027 start_codon:yes stop_codon:yes gene_type:complete